MTSSGLAAKEQGGLLVSVDEAPSPAQPPARARAGGAGEEGPEGRRARLTAILRARSDAVPGGELARLLGVSRQVVVQDIAVLRAAGATVVPSPRGYLWRPSDDGLERAGRVRARVAVRHSQAETATELHALVAAGVRVVDVVVEHPLYGELRGYLDLGTPEEVDAWVESLARHQASLLSVLTGGVHLHTLEATDPLALTEARDRLAALGFLLL
jgi:uncharacterized protein